MMLTQPGVCIVIFLTFDEGEKAKRRPLLVFKETGTDLLESDDHWQQYQRDLQERKFRRLHTEDMVRDINAASKMFLVGELVTKFKAGITYEIWTRTPFKPRIVPPE